MLLIITDAHISQGTDQAAEFAKMLETISRTSCDLLFLGDIMELWVAIPRYENDLQRQFVQWCLKEKEHRHLYFIEGNHEFYVASTYCHAFTQASETELILSRTLFTHGQRVQEPPWGLNRMTQAFFKTGLARFLISIMPRGEQFIAWLKKKLGSHGRYLHPVLPMKKISRWAERKVNDSSTYQRIILGHFHAAGLLPLPGQNSCQVLPAWKDQQEISAFDPITGHMTTQHWKEMLKPLQTT